MAEITLEKIDLIRERTGVSYTEAKEALEVADGNVVDALVYLESKAKSKGNEKIEELYATKDEFKDWLKNLISKGNISRIKIRKEDRVLIDIPVNAGIAAGIFALIWPPLIAIGILTAVYTKVTIEIIKEDGSVEIVNTVIKNAVKDVKDKASDLKDEVKEKVTKTEKDDSVQGNVYKYTVKFDDFDDKEVEKNSKADENNL